MARIAIDVDDTLYSFRDAAVNMLFNVGLETGDEAMIRCAYAEWPEWRTPTDMLGLDKWLSIIAMVHEDEAIRGYDAYPDSVNVCNELSRAGHEITYVTARAENTHDATYDWLFRKGFLLSGCKLVCAHNKTPYLLKSDYLIDDRVKTLVEFVNMPRGTDGLGLEMPPRRAFGLAKEYNRAVTDVPKIYLAPTWAGIGHYLRRKGILEVAVNV